MAAEVVTSVFVRQVKDSFLRFQRTEPESFDVTITDPPFDEWCQSNITSGTAMKRGDGKGGIPKVTLAFNPLNNYAWVASMLALSKRWTNFFCTVEAFGDLRRQYKKEYTRGCIWYKPNAMGQLTGDRPATAYEGFACLHRAKPTGYKSEGKRFRRWNGRGSFGLWVCNGTRGERNRHPNQKPLDLCLKLVALFSDRGETVFDPFAGSGRIGQACYLLGRNYEGWERDPAWVKKANADLERLGAEYGYGSYPDESALLLCRAKRSDVLDTE